MIRELWQRLFGSGTLPDPNANLRQLVEARQLQLQSRLLETQLNWYDNLVNPWEPWVDTPDFWSPMGPGLSVPPNIDSQKRGEVLPVYITEYQLKLIRDQSRRLLRFNEFAICASENRKSYIIGKGLQYQCALREDAEDSPDNQAAVKAADRCLKWFIAKNNWAQREREAVFRADRDGDAFIRLFHTGEGKVVTRFVEPEHVRSPNSQPEDWFGVESIPGDVETIRNYWVVNDPLTSWVPDKVAAREIVHIKLNVESTAKRGLPTFMAIKKNLDRASNLLHAMNAMGLVQSSYAVLRKHKNYSASSINAFQQAKADYSVNQPTTGKTQDLQAVRPGSIIDTTDNTEYEFPHADLAAAGLVEVIQADLRAAASRLNMPEYMLSSDSSNSNYASTLVSEAPSTKNFESLQAFFGHAFGDGEYGDPKTCGVMWRVLRLAVEYGALPRRVLRVVQIQVEGPQIVARDRPQETNRYKVLHEAKVLSKGTWAKNEGLDYDQERVQLDEEGPDEQPGTNGQTNGKANGKANGKGGLAGLLKRGVQEVKDASGHEHDESGRFGSGGGHAASGHVHGGVGDTAAKMESAAKTSKSRKELSNSMKAIATEAKSGVKAAAAAAVAKVAEDHLSSHPRELRNDLKGIVKEHVGDFANDLIGHINHETRYTIGQLKGGESKSDIKAAMETAHENLGPEGVKEKFDFNSKYLHSDLVDSFKAHGVSDGEAAEHADTIVKALGKHLGIVGHDVKEDRSGQLPRPWFLTETKDSGGHEHKGKGEGGGQFTSGGGGGGKGGLTQRGAGKKPLSASAKKLRGLASNTAAFEIHDPAVREEHLAAFDSVLAAMPEKATKLAMANTDKMSMLATPEEATARFRRYSVDGSNQLQEGEVVCGFYSPRNRALVLDSGVSGSHLDTAGVHAHELAHAIDGPGFTLSTSPAWKAAYAEEIAGGDLSDYATTNQQEGFAEFARAMYTGTDEERADCKANFPKSHAFFQKKGLV